MSELFIDAVGPPGEVVQWRQQGRPVLDAGQVLVRMEVAAINPADLNFIAGTYGTKPTLPCPPGMEGYGVIEEVGAGVTDLVPGTAVLPLQTPGAWAQWRVLKPDQVLVLPAGVDPFQAALLRINPVTAWGLLHSAGPPAAGSWVVQNAASSAAGHCVIQIARSLGLRTLNFVRRAESMALCTELGGDLVFMDDPSGHVAAQTALAESGVPAPMLALNAVGGDSALRLLNLLGQGGTHVTYGAMGRQALKVPNGLLIFKGLVLRGFWLTVWRASLSPETLQELYQNLITLVQDGKLRQQIAATYPVTEFRTALAHAAKDGRNGKILLTF